jgi:hypothetical protein
MSIRALFMVALAAVALPAVASDKIRIVDEGKLGTQWSLVPGTQLMPPYPDAYAQDPEEVCMVVGYMIGQDGHTSDFSLLKSWTSGSNSRARSKFWAEFGDLAARAIAQWRYAPASGAGVPVYTATTFVFGSPGSVADTRSHCEVADLTRRMVELRYDGRAGRMMSRGIFSRLDIDPEVQERMRQDILAVREMAERGQMAATERMQQGGQQSAPPPPPAGNK